MRYQLRYTQDLQRIRQADDWRELVVLSSDYLLHIIDLTTGEVVWQNGKSNRYGNQGVAK